MPNRKKPGSAIGMSMLDLISNAVAAVFILFIILVAMRLPPIPPERARGTLYLRYALEGRAVSTAQLRIWVEVPEQGSTQAKQLLWYQNTASDLEIPFAAAALGTSQIIYQPADSQGVVTLMIHDPYLRELPTGLIYQDYSGLDQQALATNASISIIFLQPNHKPVKQQVASKSILGGTSGILSATFDLKHLLTSASQ